LDVLNVRIAVLLKQVVTKLDNHIVVIFENVCDPSGYELLHNLNIDLLDIDALVELRRELRRLQQLRIHAHRHGGGVEVVALRA
jgi:hypothetical protein